jgi:predicted dienelactone hydrolase
MHPELRAPVRLEAARGDGGACLGSVDRKIAAVAGQGFIGCGTVLLLTGARPTAAARQMECIAAALKSPDKSGYSLQRMYALGLAVQGRFD